MAPAATDAESGAMITSLALVDFKNFADETLSLGPFTVIVGENASGKSNIRDAFRFLHGIDRGYTLAEIQVKELYFDVLAKQRGADGGPDGGRSELAGEAARRIDTIRRKCPEDFDALAKRLEAIVRN